MDTLIGIDTRKMFAEHNTACPYNLPHCPENGVKLLAATIVEYLLVSVVIIGEI